MYMMAKHLHLTAVGLSILLFVIRFLYGQMNPAFLQKKWVKIVPHVIDTVLLLSAIWLCFIISQYPLVNGWLTFKVFGVVAYIFLGLVALKKAKTPAMKWGSFVAALIVLGLTAKVAVTKQLFF
ncbi:SirB2 family protein [Alteromonas lipolytica]|uniref:Invasion protein n=1 Tax=Alteromonas lipolytica TaxID=1856405 RepID=A0A1E8FFJ1_9ALTE|nr:SirB2 family protein [Alteromonas lipolytica]OFI34691.1 invasion protein [Alteromonas lipolytica]GGF53203.1 SirB family protein [Alteromonas lipolytica]